MRVNRHHLPPRCRVTIKANIAYRNAHTKKLGRSSAFRSQLFNSRPLVEQQRAQVQNIRPVTERGGAQATLRVRPFGQTVGAHIDEGAHPLEGGRVAKAGTTGRSRTPASSELVRLVGSPGTPADLRLR
jgi:hypothetical protein